MSNRKRSSLFFRLMFSIALPEIVIFSLVAVISYIQVKDLFEEISKEKVENYQEELLNIIEFQDVALSQMSRHLDHYAQDKMKILRFRYFSQTDSIETVDLKKIRAEIGMNQEDDICIINQSGIVVNTTFDQDLNLNLFSFGGEFREFLMGFFTHDYYIPQPLSLENKTRKFKKYIYQSTRDHKYIIQLGFYSTESDKFNSVVSSRLNDIETRVNDIKSIDLIMAPWKPISFYKGTDIFLDEIPLIQKIFEKKENIIIDENDSRISYIYIERIDSEAISWNGILKVVYDKKRGRNVLMNNLLQKMGLFGFGMILLFFILYFNVRLIVKPIHSLSKAARQLGQGHLNNRASAEGTKEMVFLAESFNQMAENLEKSHREITLKNDEIMASINYAKRIQEAILPREEVIGEVLKEHFILFKPKDVVAGDFYWFEVIDDEIYIAAADCTGHGVPGAMVSVVCSNSLNQAVKELKIKEPGKILDTVRDLVVETFNRSHHDVKDGMDICFCRINLTKRQVVYSGAQNSLYRVTKSNGNNSDEKFLQDESHVLIEYKGNKQPIGKFTNQKPFTEEIIQCEPGDCIYLFTDGFADQFGGPDGRKFMYKPFKKLLLSLHDKKMSEQITEIDNVFEDWKKAEHQIDDVCVIGIRIL